MNVQFIENHNVPTRNTLDPLILKLISIHDIGHYAVLHCCATSNKRNPIKLHLLLVQSFYLLASIYLYNFYVEKKTLKRAKKMKYTLARLIHIARRAKHGVFLFHQFESDKFLWI